MPRYKNTIEAFEVLVEVSKYMQTITYEDLAIEVGKKTGTVPAAVSLAKPLGEIRDDLCRQTHIPWLNALAVNKGRKFRVTASCPRART